ncbi:hypothetical protein ABEP44_12620, partial [Cutibacterium acnes]
VTIREISSARTIIAEGPAPTHRIIIGPRAILGKLFNTTKYGSITLDTKSESHSIIAINVPKIVPNIKPITVSRQVTPI